MVQEAWQELAHAFAFQQATLSTLASPIQRALSEALCRSAGGMSSGDATNQYVRDLLGPITRNLATLSKREDLQTFSQQPDVILQVKIPDRFPLRFLQCSQESVTFPYH
jgi:hypothetical protein